MNTSDIKRKTTAGIFWKFSERIIAQLVSLVVSIVLARLLTPDDYSVVGIVAIFFAFANLLISSGFGTALVQKKDADLLDYSSVLWVSMLMASILYAVLFCCAPWIASLYDKDILIPVIRVMGLTLFINAFKSILCSYISSHMQFRKFFFATIGGTVVSAVVGLVMAWQGAGPWALVAQQMTNSLIDTVILAFTTKVRFVLRVSWERLKGLLQYGWKIFASSLIHQVYSEINPLVIGLKYNSADLSFYTKGRSFPALINATVGDTFSAVLFPAMAKLQDDKEAVLRYTRRFMRLSSFLIFPLMVGFMAVSDSFISILLTDKWMDASFYIKIFCVTYMFDMIHGGNLQAIRALGRSDVILITEIIKKSSYFLVTLGFIFFTHTPELLAVSVIVHTVIAIIVNTAPNRKLIHYHYRLQVLDLLPNFCTSMLMGACVYAMGFLPMHRLGLLALQVAAGAVIYVGVNLLIRNENLRYLLSYIKTFGKRGNDHENDAETVA